MSRSDLLRAVSRATGESVGLLGSMGFQLEPGFPRPTSIRHWRQWLKRSNQFRGQRRKRIRSSRR